MHEDEEEESHKGDTKVPLSRFIARVLSAFIYRRCIVNPMYVPLCTSIIIIRIDNTNTDAVCGTEQCCLHFYPDNDIIVWLAKKV